MFSILGNCVPTLFFFVIVECVNNIFVHLFRFLGNGLLTQTNAAVWKTRRRAYDAAFHKRYIAYSIDTYKSKF